VLELVEGQTLAEKLEGQRAKGLRLDEALAIARQLADALDLEPGQNDHRAHRFSCRTAAIFCTTRELEG
jgi:hypothetical protein